VATGAFAELNPFKVCMYVCLMPYAMYLMLCILVYTILYSYTLYLIPYTLYLIPYTLYQALTTVPQEGLWQITLIIFGIELGR
jgi:hypothetical protein